MRFFSRSIYRLVANAGLSALAAAGMAADPATSQPATTPTPATQPADPSPVPGSLITLHEKNASAEKVYRSVFKQAGIPWRSEPNDPFISWGQLPPITIDVDRQPFLEVIRQLGGMTNLWLLKNQSTVRLARTMGFMPGRESESGAFLFDAVGFIAAINLNAPTTAPANAVEPAPPAQPRPRVGGELVVMVYYEPGLKIISFAPMMHVDAAVDDHGNSLVPSPPKAVVPIPAGRNLGWPYITASLKFPDKNPGKRMKYVRGTETVVLIGDDGKPRTVKMPFEFKDVDMDIQGN